MTVSDLQDHIVATLLKRVGGSKRRWRAALGAIRLHDLATHPHCNWSATPSGSAGEIDTIERLLDDIRAAHPIVAAG